MKMEIFGATDVGCVRQNNEDTFICQSVWDDKHFLLAAIDGMGGYEGGEVAAAIARDTIINYLQQYPRGERIETLKNAVCAANNAIHDQQKGELSQMGCVATVALVECDKLVVNMVHVGDTRMYQQNLATGRFEKLSHDHSLVGYREEIGELSELEAMNHPQRSRIDRSLGDAHHEVADRNFLEAAQFQLLPNSMLLLCSDGLCDMITSDQMSSLLLAPNCTVQQRVSNLIDAAKKAGGKDNVTVVLFEYLEEAKPQPAVEKDTKPDSVQAVETPVSQEDEPEANQNVDVPSQGKKMPWVIVYVAVTLLLMLFSFIAGRQYQTWVVEHPATVPTTDTVRDSSLVVDTAVSDTCHNSEDNL